MKKVLLLLLLPLFSSGQIERVTRPLTVGHGMLVLGMEVPFEDGTHFTTIFDGAVGWAGTAETISGMVGIRRYFNESYDNLYLTARYRVRYYDWKGYQYSGFNRNVMVGNKWRLNSGVSLAFETGLGYQKIDLETRFVPTWALTLGVVYDKR